MNFAQGKILKFYQNVFVSDIAIFVLKRDVKLQLTNYQNVYRVYQPRTRPNIVQFG